MALPPLRIEIGADASQFSAAMTNVQSSLDRVAAKFKITVTETGRLTDEFGQNVRVTKALRKELAAAGVNTDEFASDLLQLRKSAEKAKSANDNLANGIRATGSGSKRFSYQMQNVSYQVQDFSVQLASGTSATRALSQQLPQLVSGFGILGAVLGGAVGVIALLVTEMDRTDSAVRRLMINLNLLSARSISETETRIADLKDTMETNNRTIEATEELMRRTGTALRNGGEAERKYIEDLKRHNEEITKTIELEEKRLTKLKEAEKTPVEPGPLKRTGRPASDDDIKIGGESAGAEGMGDKAYTEQLRRRLDSLEWFTMTEQEMIQNRYADRHATLVEALANELLTEEEFLRRSTELHRRQAEDLARIEEMKQRRMTDATGNMFGAMANLAKAGGKKMAGLAKGFAVAEAIINTYAGATRAFKDHPFPLSAAIAATVIANGLANVASILAVNTSGSGSAAPSGGGGQAAAAAPAPLEVTLSGFGPNDLFTGSQLSGLFDRLQDEAGDRGVTFARVAA